MTWHITHVIRGDDHLTNTFRQIQIYDAMGWEKPAFAHIPLIHGADGAKLSKRHGAVSILEFREQGFLPEALCNYLLRLGWGHGDAEFLTRDEQIELFTLEGVGRAASRMDYAKLTHLNGMWLRQADDARLVRGRGAASGDGRADGEHRSDVAPRGSDAGAEGAGEDARGAGRLLGLSGAHCPLALRAEGAGAADG